ncbi:MAG TPA: hypothetical protein PK788_14765, partial [Gemmatimonadaceae bacterium]|nr:hypothetical protein [Gemmatimonadaceae bacterium]
MYWIALFHHLFPGAFRSPSYPTRDGVIPMALFDAMLSVMSNISDRQRFTQTLAVAHGIGMVMAGKEPGTMQMTRQLAESAVPFTWEREGP